MAYRESLGRPLKVQTTGPKTVRNIIRGHLQRRNCRYKEVAKVWKVSLASVYYALSKTKRPLTPQQIEAFIEGFELSEVEAHELRYHGAIEAGWRIHIASPSVRAIVRGAAGG